MELFYFGLEFVIRYIFRKIRGWCCPENLEESVYSTDPDEPAGPADPAGPRPNDQAGVIFGRVDRLLDPIVWNYHGVSLRESDRGVLQGQYWLTDTIISFYFEYLARELFPRNTDWLFVSAELTQLIRLVQELEMDQFLEPLNTPTRDFIFLPLNNNNNPEEEGGSHWSLLVFSRSEKAFYHFDSSNHSNVQFVCIPMVARLKRAFGLSRACIRLVDCVQQGNRHDCGIHVLCNLDVVTRHIEETGLVEQVGLPDYPEILGKRRRILSIIDTLRTDDNPVAQ